MMIWEINLAADFGASGIWNYDGKTWTGLVGWDAEKMEPIDF